MSASIIRGPDSQASPVILDIVKQPATDLSVYEQYGEEVKIVGARCKQREFRILSIVVKIF
jgi:hypothetical protein